MSSVKCYFSSLQENIPHEVFQKRHRTLDQTNITLIPPHISAISRISETQTLGYVEQKSKFQTSHERRVNQIPH